MRVELLLLALLVILPSAAAEAGHSAEDELAGTCGCVLGALPRRPSLKAVANAIEPPPTVFHRARWMPPSPQPPARVLAHAHARIAARVCCFSRLHLVLPSSTIPLPAAPYHPPTIPLTLVPIPPYSVSTTTLTPPTSRRGAPRQVRHREDEDSQRGGADRHDQEQHPHHCQF